MCIYISVYLWSCVPKCDYLCSCAHGCLGGICLHMSKCACGYFSLHILWSPSICFINRPPMITTYLDLFIKVVSREIITAVSENIASLMPCLEIPPLFLWILRWSMSCWLKHILEISGTMPIKASPTWLPEYELNKEKTLDMLKCMGKSCETSTLHKELQATKEHWDQEKEVLSREENTSWLLSWSLFYCCEETPWPWQLL